MTAHAVVFLNHPPARLNIPTCVFRLVLVAVGQRGLLAAEKERGQGRNLFLRQMQVGHAELFSLRLDHALIVNIGLSEFVLEKSLVVVPDALGRAVGQTLEVLRIPDRFMAAALGNLGE